MKKKTTTTVFVTTFKLTTALFQKVIGLWHGFDWIIIGEQPCYHKYL